MFEITRHFLLYRLGASCFTSLLFCLMSISSGLASDFNFDFQADPDDFRGGYISIWAIMNVEAESTCNRDGFGQCTTNTNTDYLVTDNCGPPSCNAAPKHGESTPMLYERIRKSGVDYLHMVIGDPAEGFAQDVYIRGTYYNAQDSFVTSTWAAEHNTGVNNDPTPGTGPLQGGGNGTANPEKVIVRQILGGTWNNSDKTWSCGDAEFCSEFLKDNMLTKPRIMQMVNEPDMTAEFVVDMRTIGYLDMESDVDMVNKVTVTDPNFFYGTEGNFDSAHEQAYFWTVHNSIITKNNEVTAGKYKYNATADLTEAGLYGAGGSYEYWEDTSFNQETIDWCSYYTREQNDPNALICK